MYITNHINVRVWTITIQYEVNMCLIFNILICKLILILSGLPEVWKVAKMANFVLSFKIWSVWDLTLPCVIRARKVSISWVATPIRLSRLNLSKRPFRFQSAFFWDIEKDRLTMISAHWATKYEKVQISKDFNKPFSTTKLSS